MIILSMHGAASHIGGSCWIFCFFTLNRKPLSCPKLSICHRRIVMNTLFKVNSCRIDNFSFFQWLRERELHQGYNNLRPLYSHLWTVSSRCKEVHGLMHNCIAYRVFLASECYSDICWTFSVQLLLKKGVLQRPSNSNQRFPKADGPQASTITWWSPVLRDLRSQSAFLLFIRVSCCFMFFYYYFSEWHILI